MHTLQFSTTATPEQNPHYSVHDPGIKKAIRWECRISKRFNLFFYSAVEDNICIKLKLLGSLQKFLTINRPPLNSLVKPTASYYPLVVISVAVLLEKCSWSNYSVYHSLPSSPDPWLWMKWFRPTKATNPLLKNTWKRSQLTACVKSLEKAYSVNPGNCVGAIGFRWFIFSPLWIIMIKYLIHL